MTKVAVNTSIRDLRQYLDHLLKFTNMLCLTPEGSLAGDCDFLSANLAARSLFGPSFLHSSIRADEGRRGCIGELLAGEGRGRDDHGTCANTFEDAGYRAFARGQGTLLPRHPMLIKLTMGDYDFSEEPEDIGGHCFYDTRDMHLRTIMLSLF